MKIRKILKQVCLTLLLIPLSAGVLANEVPCSSEPYQQFKFWVGEWSVETPDGKPAGSSTISLEQQGCVIVEHWQSATSAYTGTSFNFYDAELKQWRQLWLDNQGGKLELYGEREGQQMVLRSKPIGEANDTYQQITWTANEDGTVRQFWQSFKSGEAPTTLFDGHYRARIGVDIE